jgi:hypothetical protein
VVCQHKSRSSNSPVEHKPQYKQAHAIESSQAEAALRKRRLLYTGNASSAVRDPTAQAAMAPSVATATARQVVGVALAGRDEVERGPWGPEPAAQGTAPRLGKVAVVYDDI